MSYISVVGLFKDRFDADGAVHALMQNGFNAEDIRLVVHADKSTAFYKEEHSSNVKAGIGAAIGGIGAFLIGITTLMLPVAAVGAGLGAAVGATIGGFLGLDMTDDEAKKYEEGVRKGGTVVSVRSPVSAITKAVTVMTHHHATTVDQHEFDEGATTSRSGRATAITDFPENTARENRPLSPDTVQRTDTVSGI